MRARRTVSRRPTKNSYTCDDGWVALSATSSPHGVFVDRIPPEVVELRGEERARVRPRIAWRSDGDAVNHDGVELVRLLQLELDLLCEPRPQPPGEQRRVGLRPYHAHCAGLGDRRPHRC